MQADELQSPFLTTAEVAQWFRASKGTVARWAREGLLTAIRTPGGRELLFRREEVVNFTPRPTGEESVA